MQLAGKGNMKGYQVSPKGWTEPLSHELLSRSNHMSGGWVCYPRVDEQHTEKMMALKKLRSPWPGQIIWPLQASIYLSLKGVKLHLLSVCHGNEVKAKATAEKMKRGKAFQVMPCGLGEWMIASQCWFRECLYSRNLDADEEHFEFRRIKMSQEPMISLNNNPGKRLSLGSWFVLNTPMQNLT
jgi:hypothetical protein